MRPVEAAALLRRGLVRAGFETPESQVDVVLAVLRARFARGTRQGDLLVVETLRVFGSSESVIWAVFQEWCEEFGRDVGVVFEHLYAPDAGDVEEAGGG